MPESSEPTNEERDDEVSEQEETTPTSKRKRKEASSQSKKKKTIKAKKFSEEETKVLLAAYTCHKGNWDLIMDNPEVKALNRTRKNCENRIDYLRTKKNKKIAKHTGNEVREKIIIPNIRNALATNNNDLETTLNSFTTDGDESLSEHETVTPPQSPTSNILHEYDKDLVSPSVDSTSLTSISDISDQTTQIRNARQVRNLEIQKSTQKRNEIIQNIREQKEEKAKSSNFRDELMVMMVNSMQQQQMFTNMIMAKMFGVDFNTVTVNQNQSNVRGMLFSQPSTQNSEQLKINPNALFPLY